MNVIQLRTPGGPEVLELVEKPLPVPAANEVLVRALAIGVNSADMLIRRGVYNWMPPLPAVPGNEMAGVVEVVGRDVTDVKIGQRVLVSSRELPFRGGCYAQAICVPAEAVYSLPDAIPPHDAVTLPNYQLAGAMLYDSGVCLPRSILIHGAAGGVATAVIQLAVADGIRAIGTVSSEEKRAFATAAGAPHVLLRGTDDLLTEVKGLTDGRGVDVVFAAAGPTFIKNLEFLAPRGTLVSFSIFGGLMPEADIFGALRHAIGKSLGVRVYSIHTLDHEPEKRRGFMQRAIDLMAEGRLRPPPATMMPLAEARRAHELMEAATTLGKVVLMP
jgi:NADPH2:quinone reductase